MLITLLHKKRQTKQACTNKNRQGKNEQMTSWNKEQIHWCKSWPKSSNIWEKEQSLDSSERWLKKTSKLSFTCGHKHVLKSMSSSPSKVPCWRKRTKRVCVCGLEWPDQYGIVLSLQPAWWNPAQINILPTAYTCSLCTEAYREDGATSHGSCADNMIDYKCRRSLFHCR